MPTAKSATKRTPKSRQRRTPKKRARGKTGPKPNTRWHTKFLKVFEETAMVNAACEAVGVSRTAAYEHRQRYEDFAIAWHDAEIAITEKLEREAMRRAVSGDRRELFTAKGELIKSERVYSDTLLIFLLKARDPDRFRERVDVKHSGKVDVPTAGTVDLSKYTLQEARTLSALLAKGAPDSE